MGNTDDMTIRIALLGTGRIGRVHTAAIAFSRGARILSISDAFADAVDAVISHFGCEILNTDAAVASSTSGKVECAADMIRPDPIAADRSNIDVAACARLADEIEGARAIDKMAARHRRHRDIRERARNRAGEMQ